jgi:hypothetical protein
MYFYPMEEIINKVANSGLVTIDLETMRPQGQRLVWDIKDQLWQGLVLKESDFREYLKQLDTECYRGAHVAVHCSTDAIVPTWAYMLIASKLNGVAATVFFGTPELLEAELYTQHLANLPLEEYRDKRIVVKGCGDVPTAAFVQLVNVLQPVVKSILFGEPCSTVPVYKKNQALSAGSSSEKS